LPLRSMPRVSLAVVLFLCATIAFAGTPTAQVRLGHAVPDAGALDVLFDGKIVIRDILFTNITHYLPVDVGKYAIKVVLASTNATVMETDLSVSANTPYTIVATGNASKVAPAGFIDDLRSPSSGHAAARFVHLSPNAPALDVNVVGGSTLFSNVTFKQATPYIQLASGSYNITVTLHGSSTVALTLSNLKMAAGKVYSAFAEGLFGGSGMQALQAVLTLDK